MPLRLCACGCKKMFDRTGRQKYSDECRARIAREASRNAATIYRATVTKTVKREKIKIYNNPCRGTRYDEHRKDKLPCPNKTGVNRFFCHECFTRLDIYEINQR